MDKKIEIQQENINKLIKLARENPTLKIIPMVDTEVIQDYDFNCWAGVWDNVGIDEIYQKGAGIYFKSEDFQELVEEYIDNYDKGHPTNEEEIERWANKQVNNLEWEKVITIRIKAL